MAEPFLGEIRVMSFGFAPSGWALCNGQLMPINANTAALFSLLGTTYGGDGTTNFALPSLQARVPISVGNGHTLGEQAGEQNHTLQISELATHVHAPGASSLDGDVPTAAGNLLAGTATTQMYSSSPTNVTPLMAGTVSSLGGSQAHLNMQPFLVLNFCIALQGIFPSQT
jgi:microcystin-dependent protein